MHAIGIVRELLLEATPQMHSRRLGSLTAAVSSALEGAALSVTSLGRGVSGEAYEKHRIKRIDRLVSNRHLHAERVEIYAWLTRRFVCGTSRPVVSVDWSNLDEGKTRYLLRASVALQGRAFTVYEEVHPRERFMKAKVERHFLTRLAEVLGPSCRPIIVTDAGFHNPWLRAVCALDWDFICRVRGRVMVAEAKKNDWEPARALFAQAGKQPKRLAKARLSCHQPLDCHFLIAKQTGQARHHLNRDGRRVRGHYSNEQARAHREPWLLVTSVDLAERGALKRIVRAYKTRMQIEEAFRDLKSERFGLGFEASRATQIQRIEMLLLIALLVLTVAWIIGQCVAAAGLERHYQANTVRKRKVLSTVYLGRRAWRDTSRRFTASQWLNALASLADLIYRHSDGF